VHLDGARLWNASAATGTTLSEFSACAETVMVSFSKGLGAPIGACLAADAAVIDEAHVHRRRMGGGMRQSGIMAAAALHGLECHLGRLGEDHELARELASLIDGAGGARVIPPDTNIVMLDLPEGRTARALARAAAEHDVLVAVWAERRIRMVTHLDVDRARVRHAMEVLRRILDAPSPV
jgi:threonine aldolase